MLLACHIWHICQLLDAHISDNYVSIYASYELTAITNVTRSTCIYIFSITSICPWTNMPSTLHKYGPLHFYYSLHIQPTMLHISIENQYMATFLYHTTAKYVTLIYMPLKCQIHAICQITWCAHMMKVCQYIWHTNSLALTMWPAAQYTDTNDENTVDNTGWWCHSQNTYTELATGPNRSRRTK